jgi:hypothetical protein
MNHAEDIVSAAGGHLSREARAAIIRAADSMSDLEYTN